MNKPHKPIRVLVVDDSPFIRMSLKKILSQDQDIEVIDTARDGLEGILKIQTLKPDVITLDIEMPVMNGIQALDEIMRWQPTPVIILSAVTPEGGKLTMKAFDLGAVEVVAKPSGQQGDDLITMAQDIILKIKSVAGIDTSRLKHREIKTKNMSGPTPLNKIEIVAIGTSTGGPTALQTVLSQLPKNFPVPVMVAQHMPAGFTASLAARLDGLCQVRVKEAEEGEVLKSGTVYIGPSGKQFQVRKVKNQLVAQISNQAPIATLYKPSVDVMLMSLAEEVGKGVLGVIMTGMGSDGLEGIRRLKVLGAFAIAESEKTCIVYGMPKSIVTAGLADRVEGLPDIAGAIEACVNRR